MKDVANKPISPLNVDEVVRVVSKCTIPPFGHKAIHGKVNLVLHGYKMNVMTHGLEKRSPSLPLGIDVQTVYATLADGSNRVTVVLRNNTRDWLEISAAKGASPKQVGSGEGKTKTPSAKSNHISIKSSKVKRAPYLNLDAFCRFIGPKNLGKALIDDELTTCLLDNGAQLNFITPAYAQE